jgi:type I restriction enzyme R subunit
LIIQGKRKQNQKPGEPIAQQAVVEAIVEKHDAATNSSVHAILATVLLTML